MLGLPAPYHTLGNTASHLYTYKLKLLTKIKIYLMFYISLLQLLKGKPLIYKVPPPPPIIVNNGNSSYFIDLIDDI
jgi:hypothetical protein